MKPTQTTYIQQIGRIKRKEPKPITTFAHLGGPKINGLTYGQALRLRKLENKKGTPDHSRVTGPRCSPLPVPASFSAKLKKVLRQSRRVYLLEAKRASAIRGGKNYAEAIRHRQQANQHDERMHYENLKSIADRAVKLYTAQLLRIKPDWLAPEIRKMQAE